MTLVEMGVDIDKAWQRDAAIEIERGQGIERRRARRQERGDAAILDGDV